MTTTHIGRKISRLRELKQMKQEALAEALGISQQAVSKLEQSEIIEEATLNRVAKALGFSPEIIRGYNEESVINNIQNNYEGSNNQGSIQEQPYFSCTINPLDKLMEVQDENRKLYEALLKEKDEKIALLKQMLDKGQ
jgi:transcriptional regulator with XRE-family HTH domain